MPIGTDWAALAPRAIALELEGGRNQCLLRGRPETAGMRSGLVVLAPGTSVGKHNTGSREELIVVLDGHGEFRSDGAEPLRMHAGSAVYCPPRRGHDVVNTGRGALRYVYVAAEAR